MQVEFEIPDGDNLVDAGGEASEEIASIIAMEYPDGLASWALERAIELQLDRLILAGRLKGVVLVGDNRWAKFGLE